MRKAFFAALEAAMAEDKRVTLVTGDMGFGVIESIRDRFPRQYVNAGVAEQNMTGIATGLALSGRISFTYSIANFPTLRCLEQIRNDACYHDADVKIVSVGAGLSYGSLGATHHAVEDVAALRALPNLTIVSPADPFEAEWAARVAARTKGPFYLRLGRVGEPRLHAPTVQLELGRAAQVHAGQEVALFATGAGVEMALAAASILETSGVSTSVHSFHTLKPLDESVILRAAAHVAVIATIEEHSVLGGLGSAVAEVLAEAGFERPPAFRRIGLPPAFVKLVGGQTYLREAYGLTPLGIVDQLRPLIEKRLGARVPGVSS